METTVTSSAEMECILETFAGLEVNRHTAIGTLAAFRCWRAGADYVAVDILLIKARSKPLS